MADYERSVLEHYQLPTAYPDEWPADKDLSDASEDEKDEDDRRNNQMNRRKSRYAALDRADSRRSLVPGAENNGDGIENLVQKDEPDPLGTTDSVVRALRSKGLPVQDDVRLRNRFLLSSTTFSPAMFLSQVHADASTQSLLQGLDVLSRSIDQKSASLKVLVESNFERFVKAKSTIDNVYMEMKTRGEDTSQPETRSRPHSRQVSRSSFRNSIGGNVPVAVPVDHSKRKNALVKESEYGVLGIKAPLVDVSAKVEEVWGPALGGRERESTLKMVSSTLETHTDVYEVGNAITECINRKDYEGLMDEYTKARKLADSAKRTADELKRSGKSPSDVQLQQILVTARLWSAVQERIEEMKRDIWHHLVSAQEFKSRPSSTQRDKHMELIGILLELGTADNPIWVWLLSRLDYLKSSIRNVTDRSKIEIEILRRRLANQKRPSSQKIANQLKILGRATSDGKVGMNLDSQDILDLWEKMYGYLNQLLSSQGILGEVTAFWQTVQGFVGGELQKTLPTGLDGSSRKHHRLSNDNVGDLDRGIIELVDMIRDSVSAFFSDPPVEDISALFSPLPSTPMSPNPMSGSLTPTSLRDPRLTYNAKSLPPPSPRLGEAFEKFAFWPPWSNSISGVHYLAKMLSLIGSGASEMAAISAVQNGDGTSLESLRVLVGTARERSVTSICVAWNRDAENIKCLEDWTRSNEQKDLTKMPEYFNSFESSILSGMQKILYISEAMTKPGSRDVVSPPPAKLLQMVRSQFVTTLYKALSGMVENAEKPPKQTDDEWIAHGRSTGSMMITTTSGTVSTNGNADDRDLRMLLTLSNLLALRTTIVPSLTTQFENAFSVKLTEETKTIKDVLGQIDERLFKSYARPAVEELRSIIRLGISSADWPPPPDTKPQEVRPYIYNTLLALVLVHTQVTTTASSLTTQVLTYLLEQVTLQLLASFKLRKPFNLACLMQATLDIEFVAQTLTQYTTEKAGEVQSAIYLELDKGTDSEARQALQRELPEMRAVLKKLREGSRGVFGCFRRSRSGRSGTAKDDAMPSAIGNT